MAQQFSRPRGTVDLFDEGYRRYLDCVRTLEGITSRCGYRPIQVPAFEETGLFIRTVGESSDIVRKETFDLVNKGASRDYTLRPEFTAGIVRAVVENRLFAEPDTPLRFSYWGPVYRYERPGAGRLREFRQFGTELFDSRLDALSQAEVLILAYRGAVAVVGHPSIRLAVNFLGESEARARYREALVSYFTPHLESMCADCRERIRTNPLRILDCKVPSDQEIVKGAPVISDYLTEEDRAEFKGVLEALKAVGIPFDIDPRLVRGLDYYTGTVFEVKDPSSEEFGSLGGGGKYSGLMAQLGGPEMEGMGFSFGIDRLLMAAGDEGATAVRADCLCYPCAPSVDCRTSALTAAEKLRSKGVQVIVPSLSRSLKSVFKQAGRISARTIVLVNEDLTFEVRDMDGRSQRHIEGVDPCVEAVLEVIGNAQR